MGESRQLGPGLPGAEPLLGLLYVPVVRESKNVGLELLAHLRKPLAPGLGRVLIL